VRTDRRLTSGRARSCVRSALDSRYPVADNLVVGHVDEDSARWIAGLHCCVLERHGQAAFAFVAGERQGSGPVPALGEDEKPGVPCIQAE